MNSKPKKKKLSPSQQKIIKKLQEGKIIHYINGIDARCFYSTRGEYSNESKSGGFTNIPWPTIYKLEDLGLVARTTGRVALTEKGRDFIIK